MEKNGIGKEYTFKDYYSNFYDNKFNLLFEGEYYNDYKIRGKEYYENGKLKFEWEYLFKD